VAALLLDENMPRSAGAMLAKAGHDVAHAADMAPGADDMAVLALARVQHRVLVTFDADFGDLIYRQGVPAPPAVIYLRMNPIDGRQSGALAAAALQTSVVGHFVVCSRDGIRRRPMPGG
jgi:predicted nuclease of predicted toxin-antitoxin system